MEFPGGDQIGERPLDIHIDALEKLGAEIIEDSGHLKGVLKSKRVDSIFLKFPSVGATGNVMIFAAAVEGRVIVPHMQALISLLLGIGINLSVEDDAIEMLEREPYRIKGFSAVALPYPGIPTDIQPMLAVLAMFASGDSILEDRVFPERFSYQSN